MKELKSRIVVDDIIYPEGIRWFDGKVWFSDILDGKVCCYDPQTGCKHVVAELSDRPSGLGFLPDGRLLIVGMSGRKLLRLDSEGLSVLADLSSDSTMINDMVTDHRGRSYIGAHFEEEGEGGGIILVEPGGLHRIVAKNMKAPNGLAITADGKTLIVNDLFANCMLAFNVEEDGSLSRRRIFASLGDRSPDGLCLDSDGGAWIGLPFQRKFQRVEQGGHVTHEINCADKWGIASVLGGPDRGTLFIATAEVTLEAMPRLIKDPRNARQECRGWIEEVKNVPAAGAGWP